jgi:hypothetical protein
MVPVLDQHNNPLFPCKERRAKALMKRNEAKPHFQHGIFCIKLTRKETSKRQDYPVIALGIDPGSKREGYTVATKKSVILNITTNTPAWVKDHVETRRNLRRSRRQRKTPYRSCRENRSSLRNGRLPPSTKARWQAKLRIIRQLCNIIPITLINVEDISASTKKDKKKWNTSFSPLEVGKSWFYHQVEQLGVQLIKTKGYTTKQHRDQQGYKKSNNKMEYTWSAHNVDSHSLAELVLSKTVKPYYGIYKIEFLEYHRRQLHVQNKVTGGIRKSYGTTISLGMSRGSVAQYQDKLGYIGGSSKGKVAIHSIITGQRVKQFASIEDIEIMHITKQRVQFLPRLKPWVSLHNFS